MAMVFILAADVGIIGVHSSITRRNLLLNRALNGLVIRVYSQCFLFAPLPRLIDHIHELRMVFREKYNQEK